MRQDRTCEYCNKHFVAYYRKKYCSMECLKLSRHVILECVVCGKSFDSYLSEYKKRLERGHVICCSRDCRNKYTSKLLGGDGTWVEGGKYNPKHDRPPIWRRFRRKYMKEVSYICELCGEKATDLHHFVPTGMGGDLLDYENFVAVCKDCHDNLHQQINDGDFYYEIEDYLNNVHEND